MDSVAPAYIYALHCTCHPADGVRYIGKTRRDVGERLKEHRRSSLAGAKWPVNRWIAKHGASNIESSTVVVCDDATVDKAEIDAILYYQKTSSLPLLNLTLGGGGILGYRHTEGSRAIMSAKARKSLASPEARVERSLRVRGESNPSCRLGQETVESILIDLQSGEYKGNYLAEKYGVPASTISKLKNGKAWRHLPRPT